MKTAQNGFTLIELLVVVGLIVVITAGVIPTFNSYIDNQTLKTAQAQVIDDLRSTQNKALNGENSTDVIMPNYWFVRFINNASSYKIYISENNDSCPPNSGAFTEKKTSNLLPGGLVTKTDKCVFFSFENGDASSNNSNDIIVGKTNATECKRIEVNQNGFIKSINNSTSCTN